MNSPFANLFMALQQRIMQIYVDPTANPKVPVFTQVDHNFGQLDALEIPLRKNGPTVLIDFDQSLFEELGNNAQTGKMMISFLVVFFPYSSTSSITPSTYIQKGLGYYEAENQLHEALQGLDPGDIEGFEPLADIFGSLVRVSATTDKRRTDVRIRNLVYSIGIDDYSTVPGIIMTPMTLNLTDETES